MRPDTARLHSRSLAGLWVAGIDFFVTRFPVSLAASGIVMPVWLDPVGEQWLATGDGGEAGGEGEPSPPGGSRANLRADGPGRTEREQPAGAKRPWPGRASGGANERGAAVLPADRPRPAVAARATASAVVAGRGGGWSVD